MIINTEIEGAPKVTEIEKEKIEMHYIVTTIRGQYEITNQDI